MKILHIEDDEDALTLAGRACRGHDIVLERAVSLREAQARLQHETYDLLLVDLNLPDSAGQATLEALSRYDVPMVALSNFSEDRLSTAASRVPGVVDYLSKADVVTRDLPSRLLFIWQRWQRSRLIQPTKLRLEFGDLTPLKRFIDCSNLV